MWSHFNRFYQKLPSRNFGADDQLHLLNDQEIKHILQSQRLVTAIAAMLSVIGFLIYYLPVYHFPYLFPSIKLAIPFISAAVRLPWAELIWWVLLTSIELYFL